MNSPFCPSAAATAFTLGGSRVTERGTKGLIQLYYLSFSGGQVARAALCATDFFLLFFFSPPLLLFSSRSSLLPSLHLRQHLPALKCPAGQTDAGPDQSEKVIWDASRTRVRPRTHAHCRFSATHTPPLLHSGLTASTLIDLHLLYQMDSSLLLSSSTSVFSPLCVTQNIKCFRPCAGCVHKQFFF